MKIQVINVSVETKMNKSGKPYQIADLAYKNLSFQGKIEGKKLFDFGAQAESFKALVSATSGDVYEVTVVKNAQGYNDWVSVARSTADAPATTPAPAAVAVSPTATRTSNYETAEERATRQVLIVRQSSLSVAATALTTGAKTPPKPDEVIDYAKKLEKYVFGLDKPTNPFEDVPEFPAEAE